MLAWLKRPRNRRALALFLGMAASSLCMMKVPEAYRFICHAFKVAFLGG